MAELLELEVRRPATDTLQMSSSYTKTSFPTPKYTMTLEELKETMKNKSLNLLIEEGFAYEIFLKRSGKKLIAEFRQVSEDRLCQCKDNKIAVYQKTHGIWIAATIGAISVGSACLPLFPATFSEQTVKMLQASWTGLTPGFNQAEEFLKRRDNTQEFSIDYSKEMATTDKQGRSEEIRQSDQHREAAERNLEKIDETFLRLMQTILSQ
jgi:hypothetical protein